MAIAPGRVAAWGAAASTNESRKLHSTEAFGRVDSTDSLASMAGGPHKRRARLGWVYASMFAMRRTEVEHRSIDEELMGFVRPLPRTTDEDAADFGRNYRRTTDEEAAHPGRYCSKAGSPEGLGRGLLSLFTSEG